MQADPAAQLRLLDLQACDTAVAQLRHRRANLPQLAELATVEQRHSEVDLTKVEVQTRLDDVIAEQRRVEAEVDAVRARAERDQKRLTDASIPPKELEGLQHEIESLARRQGTLEDSVLEVMEQREALEKDLARLGLELTQIDARRTELVRVRDAEFAAIDADLTAHEAERGGIAIGVTDDLVALYEKIRAANAGVGAAMLRARRCDGCRMELASSELSAFRTAADDAVLRCDNCRRILIRTTESGL